MSAIKSPKSRAGQKSHARPLTPEIVATAIAFTKAEVRQLVPVQDGMIEGWVKTGVLKARWLNSRNIVITGDSVRQLLANLADKADAPAPAGRKAVSP